MHIGATIVTHRTNFPFYARDVLNYAPRTLDPDMVALWPPTELAEGYYYEQVTENYVLSDGARNMHIYYVHPLRHAEGMLMAFLPREGLLIEADLLDTHVPVEALSEANKTLYEVVQRLALDVSSIVPIHGRPVPWSEFSRQVGAQSR
jgi:hypothetical protein